MNFVFFFVHPSKYHLFKITINKLISDGHNVKIIITSKDMLEDLVNKEGWTHINIFPNGRKIEGFPPKISAIINTFRTLYRLHNNTENGKNTLYITDDLLTITGRIRNIKTLFFTDDDLTAVPESALLMLTANYIIGPECANFKIFSKKKIGFKGFKASAYLHPNIFKPKKEVLDKYNIHEEKLFIIRLVSLTATHDAGRSGLNDQDLEIIINKLNKKGRVIINSQRKINQKFEKYVLNIDPQDFLHVMAFSDLFISDSQTMSMEAGYLGVPFIRYNDFIGQISYLAKMEDSYKLGYGIKTNDKQGLYNKIDELINTSNIKEKWSEKQKAMLNDTIDLSKLLIWFCEKYPDSLRIIKKNPKIIDSFK